jgi:hypothetical protein
MNFDKVWSIFPLAYCVSFCCELKMTSAISQSQSIDNSMAFFTSPFFRLAKVACLLRSSLIRAILIFLRPISEPIPPSTTVSQRSSFLEASRSASFALLLKIDVVALVRLCGLSCCQQLTMEITWCNFLNFSLMYMQVVHPWHTQAGPDSDRSNIISNF